MKLLSSVQMRDIDRYAIEKLGIKGAVLMSNAAEHIAVAAMEKLPPDAQAAVICGTGNNGGDGIGAAAIMIEKGAQVRVFLVGKEEKLTSDSKEMLRRLSALGGILEPIDFSCDFKEYIQGCRVIIDAIFGIGLNSDLRGSALMAAETVNASGAFVIAADIPSGVNADTGAIQGGAVKANITVTFSLAKPGHFIEPGSSCCGELRVCDIGIPASLFSQT